MYTGTKWLVGHDAIRWLALPGSALFALLIGISVYVFDRNWATVQFLAPFAASSGEQGDVFGPLGQVLPAFCHAYAFSLLLILTLGRTPRMRILGAFAWFAVASGLEAMQAERVSALFHRLATLYPDSPVLGSVSNYVVNGHFDPGDLLAAGLGCAIAWLVASVPEEET